MRQIILPTLLAASLATTATAQDKPADKLLEFWERYSGTAQELFEEMMTELGPIFEDLGERIGDLSYYEPPEVLPNGDIIIRRKPDAPAIEDAPADDGSVEL